MVNDWEAWYQRYITACNDRDFATIDEYVASVQEVDGQPETPDGYIQRLKQLFASFNDVQWRVENVYVDGSVVIAQLHASGTHTGRWEGLDPTGRRMNHSEIAIYEVVDRKMQRIHSVSDNLVIYRQLATLATIEQDANMTKRMSGNV
jgi:predicted ester cyclase